MLDQFVDNLFQCNNVRNIQHSRIIRTFYMSLKTIKGICKAVKLKEQLIRSKDMHIRARMHQFNNIHLCPNYQCSTYFLVIIFLCIEDISFCFNQPPLLLQLTRGMGQIVTSDMPSKNRFYHRKALSYFNKVVHGCSQGVLLSIYDD